MSWGNKFARHKRLSRWQNPPVCRLFFFSRFSFFLGLSGYCAGAHTPPRFFNVKKGDRYRTKQKLFLPPSPQTAALSRNGRNREFRWPSCLCPSFSRMESLGLEMDLSQRVTRNFFNSFTLVLIPIVIKIIWVKQGKVNSITFKNQTCSYLLI